MNSRNLLLIVALAVAGLGGVYWSLTRITPPVAKKVEAQAKSTPSLAPAPIRAVAQATPKAKTPPVEAAKTEEPLYESQIDQVLRSNVGETETAKILINMLPTMPEEGQVEAAQHIANLLPDTDYKSVLPTLLNPNTPEAVSSVLFTDLMNRSDTTKLNAFLDIAQVPNHPNQEEALSDLQIFLDGDFGTDWKKWKDAKDAYLKKQAAEQ